jgi:hypothetical protein
MDTFSPRSVLAVARGGIGVLSVVNPRGAARAFGVTANDSNSWITRLFGSRELVLAVSMMAASTGQVRQVAMLGAAIDSIDVASSAIERFRGRISNYTFVSGGLGAALFVMLGLAAAREAEMPRPPATQD